MDKFDEMLRTLGRIEGLLVGMSQLSERVSRLEMWQSWLKGGLCAITGAFAYLFRKL
jgi:hypothetical protein